VKRIFYDFLGLNTELFLTINHATNYGYLPFFLKYLASFFHFTCFIPYLLIASLIAFNDIKKSPNILKKDKFFSHSLLIAKPSLNYALFIAIYTFLKYTVNLPRPYCSLEASAFHTIHNFDGERCLSSFPSAHSALALIISFYLWPYLNNYLKAGAIVTVFLVGLARISLAMHYPADIVYGILIGIITILITDKLYNIYKTSIFLPIIQFVYKLIGKYI
jgi:membrane-associated phospholipid phosphatase